MIGHKDNFYQLSINTITFTKTEREEEYVLKKKKYKASNYKFPIFYSKPLGPVVFRIHNFF